MKKHINKSIVLLAGALFLLVACGKQLDVEPRQSISFESALTSPDNIEAAINSVYGGLRQQTEYGRDKLALSDALSDIGFATGKSGRLQPENRNTQGAHFANWGASYGLLNKST